jgi:hypothetical protein
MPQVIASRSGQNVGNRDDTQLACLGEKTVCLRSHSSDRVLYRRKRPFHQGNRHGVAPFCPVRPTGRGAISGRCQLRKMPTQEDANVVIGIRTRIAARARTEQHNAFKPVAMNFTERRPAALEDGMVGYFRCHLQVYITFFSQPPFAQCIDRLHLSRRRLRLLLRMRGQAFEMRAETRLKPPARQPQPIVLADRFDAEFGRLHQF